MYPIRKVTKNSHVKWNVKIVESRKLSQFSPRIVSNANCSDVSESQYRIMHTEKSRQNPWALTSNTVVIEIQPFCLQRRCISFTEKWLTSSVRHWVTDVWVSVRSSKPYKNIRFLLYFLLSTIFTFHLTCEFLVTFRIGYICFELLSRFADSH